MEKTELPPDMILSGNKWLRAKNGEGLFRMLRGLWVPGPPEASLSPGSSFNEGEEMTPVSCYSQGFLFCFKLQSLLRQSIILLSGEQTQQLKGRTRQVLRAEVPGTASTASCPKGGSQPSSSFWHPVPEPSLPHPPSPQVLQSAWWQRGGGDHCQGLLLLFLSSLPRVKHPVQ